MDPYFGADSDGTGTMDPRVFDLPPQSFEVHSFRTVSPASRHLDFPSASTQESYGELNHYPPPYDPTLIATQARYSPSLGFKSDQQLKDPLGGPDWDQSDLLSPVPFPAFATNPASPNNILNQNKFSSAQPTLVPDSIPSLAETDLGLANRVETNGYASALCWVVVEHGHSPDTQCIQGLVLLTGLPPDAFLQWFSCYYENPGRLERSPRPPAADPALTTELTTTYAQSSRSCGKQKKKTSGPSKRFPCPDCSYSTNKKDDLKRHMEVDNPSKAYFCPAECGTQPYGRPDKLNEHTLKKHNKKFSPDQIGRYCQLLDQKPPVHSLKEGVESFGRREERTTDGQSILKSSTSQRSQLVRTQSSPPQTSRPRSSRTGARPANARLQTTPAIHNNSTLLHSPSTFTGPYAMTKYLHSNDGYGLVNGNTGIGQERSHQSLIDNVNQAVPPQRKPRKRRNDQC
ncbi:hypothetical protein AJ80_09531 [Polytolypa hystricis UAMH7299]|uniref:C2H2-type domain-containing protein n=1 Tax=Polytolypa hystricis (strain UAMH7299) TaxID=1447883 RepID=A0A2B7WPP2_POLH7|nr:hypothetical protein AJ80_09531 [Polytolypa hystricis UAMH7299]